MNAYARRSGVFIGLYGVIAVCLASFVGCASVEKAEDHSPGQPVGDMWRGEAAAPSWVGEQAAAALALRSERHKAFIDNGVPPKYRNAQNPYANVEDIISDGWALYTVNCLACHGFKGFGDGDALMDLRPTRMFLAYMIESPDLVDEYLMWTIADGGAEFGSSMPSFEERLTELDVWKIVAYMRAGFPGTEVP